MKPLSEIKSNERHMLNYCATRVQEIKKLKSFIKTHKENEYEVYSNSHNNFISIKFNGMYDTYNGITREKFEKIYNQVKNNIEDKEEEEDE